MWGQGKGDYPTGLKMFSALEGKLKIGAAFVKN